MIKIFNKLKIWFLSPWWQINNEKSLLILPFIYITYTLYVRLILVRIDRLLYTKLSLYQVITILFILVLLCWRIYILLQKQKLIVPKEAKISGIIWLKHKVFLLSSAFGQLWLYFYRFYIRPKRIFPKIMLFILRIYLYKLPKSSDLSNLIVLLIFEILPKTLVLIAFLLDVFYFYKFHYFYKVLFLLLLPLILNVIKTLLVEFHKDFYPAMLADFDITKKINDVGRVETHYTLKDDVTLAPDVKNMEDFFHDYFNPLEVIPDILALGDIFMVHYKIYLLFMFFLLCYIIGWLTLLIYGVFFI